MTAIAGDADTAWLTCFPEQDVASVVAYVAASWAELAARYPRAHHAGEREPVLTKSLADYLDDPSRRRTVALGGRFHAERPINYRRGGGKPKQLGRTDVEYHYPASGSAALTLEFKKLQGKTSCRNAYRNSGITRFLAGPYAPNEPSGVMCGMVTVDVASEVDAMRASLTRCQKRLACITSSDGSIASDTQEIPPDALLFETNHKKSGGAGQIRLSHLFVPLAVAPPHS
ncbi:hypothetical protein BH10PSE4_BH10PSE4_34150 [soil metagenome]